MDNKQLGILWVTISPLVTSVGWSDGTTTTSVASGDDPFNEEVGVLMAISKKFLKTSEILRGIELGKKSYDK